MYEILFLILHNFRNLNYTTLAKIKTADCLLLNEIKIMIMGKDDITKLNIIANIYALNNGMHTLTTAKT